MLSNMIDIAGGVLIAAAVIFVGIPLLIYVGTTAAFGLASAVGSPLEFLAKSAKSREVAYAALDPNALRDAKLSRVRVVSGLWALTGLGFAIFGQLSDNWGTFAGGAAVAISASVVMVVSCLESFLKTEPTQGFSIHPRNRLPTYVFLALIVVLYCGGPWRAQQVGKIPTGIPSHFRIVSPVEVKWSRAIDPQRQSNDR